MGFRQKHPVLFWEFIGVCGLFAAFGILAAAALTNAGEWCYPIIVFTFLFSLIEMVIAPIIIANGRKKLVPDCPDHNEEKFFREKAGIISGMRDKHPLRQAAIFAAAFAVPFLAAYILGQYVDITAGLLSLPLAAAVPIAAALSLRSRKIKAFFGTKNGENYVTLLPCGDLDSLYESSPYAIILGGRPNAVCLNYLYNWLSAYLTVSDRLQIYGIEASEMIGRYDFNSVSCAGNYIICIPRFTESLKEEQAEQLKRECLATDVIPINFLMYKIEQNEKPAVLIGRF